MEDRFAGIREFVAAIDGGSFTAAAETLAVTGSAVGKSISRLEARLGVQLLHRTTRRISLTTEGEAYLGSCRRILEELDQTEAFLSTGHQLPIGRVRVELPTTFGRRHIMPTLLNLSLRYEQLDLSITLQDRAVDMVGEGIDLAIRIGALGDYPDLVARQLGEQRLVICASPAYIKRRGVPKDRAELAKHDCLIGWRRSARPNWLINNGKGHGEWFEVPVRHELTDGDALLEACLSGCGLAQLPNWLASKGLATGRLLPVLPELSGVVMPIHVVWQKTRHLQPKVKIIVDELVRMASENPAAFNAT
ncbi:LysR family transcriptional regulator [Paraburkholderia ginsengiterrae]|uniref:LysR family transcriptional regulator n=1 Tax=Paraburkholderia ginsengiterrae TaxID=1462993 RepID=A0A1A9NEW4_9BURK|nr:LysR family transcriptional regulator [Paraburkholderia ginsengiterrae]OAJ61653.1 LysR family transcriptional regulator [Paraburkholderia ginsengiterrae]OAJ65251.1 LysR family transcriptional regulator [Paraburkholderia ginsengiterrae]